MSRNRTEQQFETRGEGHASSALSEALGDKREVDPPVLRPTVGRDREVESDDDFVLPAAQPPSAVNLTRQSLASMVGDARALEMIPLSPGEPGYVG